MVELVHDERQVYPTHARMIAPGFAQAVRAEVAS